ncbi:MAG TPA: hypothetical protein VJ045_09685 [Hyphomicrobiaceae bacterium]|nr:hypothetical protein [Hyphomicrobiaceae bacterium]
MRAPIHASPDDIDFTVLGADLRRGLPKVVLASALAGAITVAILSLVAPRGVSEAQLAMVAKGTPSPFASNEPELPAETDRGSLATQSVVEVDEVQKALEPRIAKLAVEVAAAEAEAERLRGAANILKGGQQSPGLNEQQLAELDAELSKAKAQRSEAEARTKSAREMLKAGNADALPDVQKSPLIQDLAQSRVRLERQLSELSPTLLPGHPRMRRLNADLAGLKRQADAEIAKVVDSLEKEAKVAALREDSIAGTLNEVKARSATTVPDEVKLRSLEANAKSKRAELERLRAQFEANRARADTPAVPVEAQVDTRARASSVPSFPNKLPYALLVMTAVLLLGTAWMVTREMLKGARRPRRHEQPWLDAPLPARSAPAVHAEQPDHRGILKLTSMDRAAIHLEMKALENGGFRTLVAGETDSVEPWAEAVDLATALAGAGRTAMIVDWSPEGDGMACSLGVALSPGLMELLGGAATFEDVVKPIPGSNVHFIACGECASQADLDLDPDRINLVLDALDEAYDHIVVVGRHEAARNLFEAIQGRFDAGIIISEAKRRVSFIQDPPGTFLGYEVADMELLRFERPGNGTIAGERLMRVGGTRRLEARPG